MSNDRKTKAHTSRSKTPALVVCQDPEMGLKVRQSLQHIGFASVSHVSNHGQAIERLKTRNFDLILFDSRPSNVSPLDFVRQWRILGGDGTLLALSYNPSVEDVFQLLREGARGFVVMPFTVEAFELAIDRALLGPPLSDAILDAADRNAALAGLVLNMLYRLTSRMRHCRQYPFAVNMVEQDKQQLYEAMQLALTFCEGGPTTLRDKIVEGCAQRADQPSTRLGRTRERLRRLREQRTVEPARVVPGATRRRQ